MARTTVIPDRTPRRGDPYDLRFVFQNPDGTPRDVSGAAWTAELAAPVDWEVDASDAVNGVVLLRLTGPETALITAPFARWDLFEHNIWGRTIAQGRLVMEDQV